MSTQELHSVMEEEIGEKLNGELLFDGQMLKWEYDGIKHLHDQLEQHLDIVAHEDKEIIEDFLTDHDDFIVSEPETHDTFVYFYIEK
jgi:hypothetical protein